MKPNTLISIAISPVSSLENAKFIPVNYTRFAKCGERNSPFLYKINTC